MSLRGLPILALILPALAPRAVAEDDNGFSNFVGRAVCLSCHADGQGAAPCKLRDIPRHATSYQALQRPHARDIAALSGVHVSPKESPVCLDCHATGADEGPRWWENTFEIDDGVQCEACHGPGSVHVAAARAGRPSVVVGNRRVIERSDRWRCASCHMEMPSHQEVLDRNFRLDGADGNYKTPVNLAVSPDGRRLYVACEQSNTLIVVDTQRGEVVNEIPVGRRPHAIAVSRDGGTLLVTNRMSDSVSVVDAGTMRVVTTISVGHDPHGMAFDATGHYALVANTGDDSLSVIDITGRREEKRLVGGAGPWSVTLLNNRTWYVTNVRPTPGRFREPLDSEVTVVDARRRVVTDRLTAVDANMLQGLAAAPGGDAVLFTLSRTKNLIPGTRLAQGWMVTNGLGIVRRNRRIDQVLLDEPNNAFPDAWDVAVAPNGRFALATSGGANEVALIDLRALFEVIDSAAEEERVSVLPNHLGLSSRFVVRRIAVGANPRGVVYSPDGRFAYVVNALDDSVSVLDASTYTVVRTIRLGGPTTITTVRRGERLFHSADATFGRQFSCRSCHPDGHVNGLTSDIEADGLGLHPVDNRTLRGILDTPPFKWEGTNSSLQRQCGPRFAVFFSRLAPFAPADLDALVRYMSTIEQSTNPFRDREGLTAAQRRGKHIFERATLNDGTAMIPQQRCIHCHHGGYKTNRITTNVATTMWFDEDVAVPVDDMFNADEYGELGSYFFIDAGLTTQGFDVPHLRNIYESPPYLHNGAAKTLEEIWTRFNMVNRHGATADLTRQQLNDLIAYLKAL